MLVHVKQNLNKCERVFDEISRHVVNHHVNNTVGFQYINF